MAVTVTDTPGQNPETAAPATPPAEPAADRPVVEITRVNPTAVHRQAAREGLRARINGQPSPTDKKPETPASGAPAASGDPSKPAATAEISMDPATLTRLTNMSRELREAKTRLASLEAVADKAKNWDEIEAARGDPKKVLEKVGFDLEAYTKKLLNGEEPEDNETAALKAEIAATKAEVEGLKTEHTKEKEEEATAAAAEHRRNASAAIDTHVSAQPERWTFGYKPEFADRVYNLAFEAVKTLGRKVTPEEAGKITDKAADAVEADFRQSDAAEQERKKLYTSKKPATVPASSPPPQTPQSRPAPTIDASVRSVSASSTPAPKHMSIAEAKAAARNGLRARLSTQR